MGKTDCAILNPIGYFMVNDPSPIMVLQPTVEMAQTVSKNRLSPMLRDTPVLSGLVQDKSRNGGNTILEKQFPGGYITLTGANSPATLASRPIRILLADEVDRYPPSAGKEGDPLMLAEKRATTFWNSMVVITSTPTIKGESTVEREYLASTMEVWNVPCPQCGEYQPLTWENIKINSKGLRDGSDTNVECVCNSCGAISTEVEWKAQQKKGKYIARHPERDVRGFYVNALSNPFTEWKKIAVDFVKAQDEAKTGNVEALKTWTNTVMAQTWDEAGVQIDNTDLMERLEDYGCDVPDEVLFLTVGVDTQNDRFEYEIVGWGIGKESWGIEYGAIYGDLKQQDIWNRLDALLLRTMTRKDGTIMGMCATCIDSGGAFTNEVYRFCLERWDRNVWAIKGSNKGMAAPYISRPSTGNRVGVPLFTLGVDTGKCIVYDRLKIETPGPGFCHFPSGDRGYTAKYFEGLTAEKHVTKYKQGRPVKVWKLKKAGLRNEPLDIRNYAQAAVEIAHLPLDEGAVQTTARAPKQQRRQISEGIE
jgi:phage terminase large subunit GpA-like protein